MPHGPPQFDFSLLEAQLVKAPAGRFREDLLAKMTEACQKEVWFKSPMDEIRAFLDIYCTDGPYAYRTSLIIPPNQKGAVHGSVPIYMVLGTPKSPIPDFWDYYQHPDYAGTPTQADFDRRALDWLRDVIIRKDSAAVHGLADALDSIRCPLYVGVTPGEVFDSIESGSARAANAEHIMRTFWKWQQENKRLPTIKELREKAGGMEASNFNPYLNSLGLSGLQKHRGP